ncbi:MAG: hypothetical protein QW724_04915, partial [Nitrososphaerota archaeon]
LRGCLDVRYRRKTSEVVPISRPLMQLEISRLNIEELIREIASKVGLSKDDMELALQVYNEFRRGGEETLTELLCKKFSETEVMQIDNQGA